MNLFNYQIKAVNDLSKKINNKIKFIKMGESPKDQYFISPTGSGKTIMAFNIIENIEEDCLVIWLAPNKLDQQSYNKYNKFYNSNQDFKKPIKINDSFTQSDLIEIVDNPSKYLIMTNWSSINKKENVLLRDNETNTNIPNLINNLKNKEIPIVFIIDEAHIGADDKKDLNKASEFLKKYSDLNIKISATIDIDKDKDIYKVEYKDVIDEGVISKSIIFNKNIIDIDEKSIIQHSINKLFELEKEYKDNNININPLLLIQIENKKDGVDKKEEVYNYCVELGINENDISLYLSDENDMPVDISKNDNNVKIIISKVAIATGWDCPRAQILCGLRDINSNKLPIQTLGRIIRMPELKHYENEMLNSSYVYTNTNSFEETFSTQPEGCIKTKNIHSKIEDNLNNKLNIPKFKKLDKIELKSTNNINVKDLIKKNNLVFVYQEYKGEISQGNSESIDDLSQLEKKDMAITDSGYITNLFNKKVKNYFAKLISNLNKIYIKNQIIKYIIDENSNISYNSAKLIMINNIKTIEKLIELINFEYEFDESKFIKDLFMKSNSESWYIPTPITYCDSYENLIDNKIKKSIHSPFYNNCNTLEKEYITSLEKDDNVKYWFKNGDNGSEYFSIPYFDKEKFTIRLFYPDFIIVNQDDTILITETKGSHLTSNKESEQKKKFLNEYYKATGINVKWYD